MLNPETILRSLNPWLSEKQVLVDFGNGTTEGTISTGAFAANIVQAAILNTENPNPILIIADLLTGNDSTIAQELVIQSSENVDKLLSLRNEIEAALSERIKDELTES